MRKFRKSIWLPLAFLILGAVFYIYYGINYKAWTDNLPNIIIYLLIICLLAWALRKKEKFEDERNKKK
jgi:peptidoglycan/LPS O-acetylase OafA/YrhL